MSGLVVTAVIAVLIGICALIDYLLAEAYDLQKTKIGSKRWRKKRAPIDGVMITIACIACCYCDVTTSSLVVYMVYQSALISSCTCN